jgi:hypothetical protein
MVYSYNSNYNIKKLCFFKPIKKKLKYLLYIVAITKNLVQQHSTMSSQQRKSSCVYSAHYNLNLSGLITAVELGDEPKLVDQEFAGKWPNRIRMYSKVTGRIFWKHCPDKNCLCSSDIGLLTWKRDDDEWLEENARLSRWATQKHRNSFKDGYC